MRSAVREQFMPFATRFESLIPWMHLNKQGEVVIALGCLLEPIDRALALPWTTRDGVEVSEQNLIGADWIRIKRNRMLAHAGPARAASYTNLLLTQAGLEKVVLDRLDAIESFIIRPTFRTWDDWPADSQLATLSMAWIDPNLPEVFPKWKKAARNHNWRICSQQCCFATTRRPELAARNYAHRRMFEAAARIASQDDPAILLGSGSGAGNGPEAA
jgi:hypothetical protein